MSIVAFRILPDCWGIPAERLTGLPLCGACKKKIFLSQPIDVNAGQFGKVIANTDIPVLVDFWAPWCGPCLQMAPALTAAAEQLEPVFRLCKLDIEKHQATAAQFNVRSIPTLVLSKDGVEITRSAGVLDTAARAIDHKHTSIKFFLLEY